MESREPPVKSMASLSFCEHRVGACHEETFTTNGRVTGLRPSDRRHSIVMTTSAHDRLRTILFNRVPEVTFTFWVIKILSTTTGETAADYLNGTIGLGLQLTTVITGAILIVLLVGQFFTRRYTPGAYWATVVLISIVGTLLTDNLTDVFGMPLWVSTAIFSMLLADLRQLVRP